MVVIVEIINSVRTSHSDSAAVGLRTRPSLKMWPRWAVEVPSDLGCSMVLCLLNYLFFTGNVTSLTALNLRHYPLEFPPEDVIQRD